MNYDFNRKTLDGPIHEIVNDIYTLIGEKISNLDNEFSSKDTMGPMLATIMAILNERISITLQINFGCPAEEYLDLIYRYSKEFISNFKEVIEDE